MINRLFGRAPDLFLDLALGEPAALHLRTLLSEGAWRQADDALDVRAARLRVGLAGARAKSARAEFTALGGLATTHPWQHLVGGPLADYGRARRSVGVK